jgi:ABC-type amino acid transport substrate-binding protein
LIISPKTSWDGALEGGKTMRDRAAVVASLGAVLFLSAAAYVDACGDKFLVVGRGVRYTRVRAAARPASILLYMNPASRVPAAVKDAKLEASLKQAGHKVQTVETASQLNDALKTSKFDLVVADVADGPALEKQVSKSAGPAVVPVLYNPTDGELAAARQEYGCALKTPSKDPLAAIDEAMAQRAKTTDAKAGQSK